MAEVLIFVSINKTLMDQNIVEMLDNNRQSLKQERCLMQIARCIIIVIKKLLRSRVCLGCYSIVIHISQVSPSLALGSQRYNRRLIKD